MEVDSTDNNDIVSVEGDNKPTVTTELLCEENKSDNGSNNSDKDDSMIVVVDVTMAADKQQQKGKEKGKGDREEVNIFREPSIIPSRLRQRRNSQSCGGPPPPKSTPKKSSKSKGYGRGKGQANKNANKGRNRRTAAFKKVAPTKSPASVAQTVTADNIFYKGTYFHVGDIVSVLGEDDNIYYAQLRGFMQDQYCEKSGVITWLIPTDQSPDPKEGFDPQTYIAGPDEDLPRKLSCMEFVMHAPSNYFKDQSSPYAVATQPRYDMRIYNTTMGTVVRSNNDLLPPEIESDSDNE